MNHQLCTRPSTGDRQRAKGPYTPPIAARLRWRRELLLAGICWMRMPRPRISGYRRAASITPENSVYLERLKKARA